MGLLGALGDTWACMYYGLKLASYMVMALGIKFYHSMFV